MTPRKYEKKKRAESTEETRGRILGASLSLHSEKGFEATTWQDIAARAGVAVGTVYYHFPTMDELVPACSSLARSHSKPPASAIFEGVKGTRLRIELLVHEVFGFYRRGADGLTNVFRERERFGVVARIADETERNVAMLVREALGPAASHSTVKRVEALMDFRVWESFRSRGIEQGVIVQTVSSLVRALTSKRS